MPPPEVPRAREGADDGSLEAIVEHLPADLVLAEGGAGGAGFDELEHDFWIDPCRFLRRACQVADYGATSAALGPAESPRAPG